MKAQDVHPIVKKYTIGDGLSIVPSLERSYESWVHDDLTGKKFLDCFSMHASMALGWNNSRLVYEADKIASICHHNPTNSDIYCEQYAEFLNAFSAITPDFKHYFFVAGGTLAIENALKAAFDYKAQQLRLPDDKDVDFDVIHLKEAFHGRSGYCLSLTNTGLTKTKWFPKFKWTRILNPKIEFPIDVAAVSEAEEYSLTEARRALETGRVAAIILEPIQGEGGDNHFRKEYFKRLRELADTYDVMLILDEVQTGVGLTGKMWCYQHFGIVPDMMCFGKKTQVCGFCATDKIDRVPHNVFTTSSRINSTWGGNLVDMVRATITFDIIQDEDIVANAEKVGGYLIEELRLLKLDNLRGRGLMIAFNHKKRDKLYEELSKEMLCLKCGDTGIRLRPPLTFSEDDADMASEIVSHALSKV